MSKIGLSIEMAAELRSEFVAIKETLDAQNGKRSEAKQEIVNSVMTGAEAQVKETVKNFLTLAEATVKDNPAVWVVIESAMREVSEVVTNNAEAFIQSELSGKFKAISGDTETLRVRAKEIREKYEILASALKQFGRIEVEELPRLGSGGRPAGTGKHQKLAGHYRIEFQVNGTPQTATQLKTVLFSASQGSNGEGDNGSFKVREFLKLLKETHPNLSNEYDGDWSVTLPNGNTLSLTRTAVQDNE